MSSANATETSLADAEAGTGIRTAVKRWTFPKPDEGRAAQVTVPFPFDSATG